MLSKACLHSGCGEGSLAPSACRELAVLANFICIISSINSTWHEEKRWALPPSMSEIGFRRKLVDLTGK